MAAFAQPALADSAKPSDKGDSQAEGWSFKLTPSYFRVPGGSNATDLNLRGNNPDWTFWLGQYREMDGFEQSRGGLERNLDFGLLRTTLSAQAASHGFFGGSVSGELGGDTFAIWGLGRTNTRTYYNLNFDPNDAITWGIGHRSPAGHAGYLYTTFDDRLGTGQRVSHAVLRYQVAEKSRLTLDVSHKRGFGDDDLFVRATGVTGTWDYDYWFVRLALDPHANFSADRMTRLAVGLRF
ncbi:MAG: hypothetical protein HGA47_04635 [Zoogloea sp.]|nr:hypothetical protein [Zoogloea sp.]